MGQKYYAVAVGRKVGVFDTWEETRALVTGFKDNLHKSFSTREAAETFVCENAKPADDASSGAPVRSDDDSDTEPDSDYCPELEPEPAPKPKQQPPTNVSRAPKNTRLPLTEAKRAPMATVSEEKGNKLDRTRVPTALGDGVKELARRGRSSNNSKRGKNMADGGTKNRARQGRSHWHRDTSDESDYVLAQASKMFDLSIRVSGV
ncbi:hypothetical protein B0T26DRAFT_751573 [Lasiosphaeria miniovina]|uniref:Ribonuclease H n=1 Tax=Lasiosphaeria miniovina TaxID=1954250 RepID=A0AA40DV54_9PEZI|nr:uncharacterized protein B0T26DRAFT_751573 [Lasiosphaeria miniovina]KAK0717529.1 hypothetical protein B0T26DRAFT_751573 [Lasiosphaeria miniovina]